MRALSKSLQGCYDVVLCGGLLNFLDNTAAQSLLSALRNCLADGGILAISNVCSDTPDRILPTWLARWPLFSRTAADLQRLCAPHHLAVTRSTNGAMLFATTSSVESDRRRRLRCVRSTNGCQPANFHA
jgi:hypothetical protein